MSKPPFQADLARMVNFAVNHARIQAPHPRVKGTLGVQKILLFQDTNNGKLL